MTQEKKNQEQNDEPIRALDPIDHVRLRPGMYFGRNMSRGLCAVAEEVFYGLISQVKRQTCTKIKVLILDPYTIQIWHNADPLPIYEFKDTGLSVLETVLKKIGSERFIDMVSGDYVTSFSVGLAAVNAVSSDFLIQVMAEGNLWEQRYQKGRKITELTRTGDQLQDGWTTCLTFTVDQEVFRDYPFTASGTGGIEGRLFDLAYLLPGLEISFENRRTGDRNIFYMPSGLTYYLEYVNRYNLVLYPPMKMRMAFEGETSLPPFELDAGFQFLETPHPYTRSFVDASESDEHGTHVDGCFQALRDSLLGHSDTIERSDFPDLFRYVTLVVSLWHPSPSFEGSMSRKLINQGIAPRAYEAFSLAFTQYFIEYPACLKRLEEIAADSRERRLPRQRRVF
jgi:DNA gyrase subunit B